MRRLGARVHLAGPARTLFFKGRLRVQSSRPEMCSVNSLFLLSSLFFLPISRSLLGFSP